LAVAPSARHFSRTGGTPTAHRLKICFCRLPDEQSTDNGGLDLRKLLFLAITHHTK
jgi:hypothetical protein